MVLKKDCKEYRNIKDREPMQKNRTQDLLHVFLSSLDPLVSEVINFGGRSREICLLRQEFLHKMLHAQGYYELLCIAEFVNTVAIRTAILISPVFLKSDRPISTWVDFCMSSASPCCYTFIAMTTEYCKHYIVQLMHTNLKKSLDY